MPYSVNNIAQINGDKGPYDNKSTDPSIKYGRNAVANYKEYLTPPMPVSDEAKRNLQQLNKDVVELSQGIKQTSNPVERKKKLAELVKKQNQYFKIVGESLIRSDEYYSKHPVRFQLKYIPGQKVDKKNLDKKALLAASYEDLGAESVSVAEMDERLKKSDPKIASKVSYAAFDLNGDGKIDAGENAAAILIEDMSSKYSTQEVLDSGRLNLNADNIQGTITNDGVKNLTTFLKKDKVEENKEIIKQVYGAFGLDQAEKEFLKDEK